MTSFLFLMAVIGVLWFTLWVVQNDKVGTFDKTSGFFQMDEEGFPPKAALKQAELEEQERRREESRAKMRERQSGRR